MLRPVKELHEVAFQAIVAGLDLVRRDQELDLSKPTITSMSYRWSNLRLSLQDGSQTLAVGDNGLVRRKKA